MIHSTHSAFTSGSPKASLASRAHSPAHGGHIGRAHRGYDYGTWSPVSFAEPEVNSLWDTTLLDRLSLPLSRYHE
jgi:hypothetical protein